MDKQKKKIIVDLDIVTVAEWDKDKDAVSFINRARSGEFEVYVPYSLLDLLDKWEYKNLSNKIKEFYELYSQEIISAQKLTNKLDELNLREEVLTKEFLDKGIKEEDILLIIIASSFRLDYLVTRNRKHLKNKEEEINNVLHKCKLKKICIVLPNEI